MVPVAVSFLTRKTIDRFTSKDCSATSHKSITLTYLLRTQNESYHSCGQFCWSQFQSCSDQKFPVSCNLDKFIVSLKNWPLYNGCGTVCRMVTSDIRGPGFESSQPLANFIELLFAVNYSEKAKIKKRHLESPTIYKKRLATAILFNLLGVDQIFSTVSVLWIVIILWCHTCWLQTNSMSHLLIANRQDVNILKAKLC